MGGGPSAGHPSLPVSEGFHARALLEDGLIAGDLPETLNVSGLMAGEYDVLLYGDSPNVASETWFQSPGGQQISSGSWSGQFQVGIVDPSVAVYGASPRRSWGTRAPRPGSTSRPRVEGV